MTAQTTAQEASKPADKVDEPAEAPAAPEKPWLTANQAERPTAPDVYLLPDEFGKLRKVLGFQYEDFLKAWNREKDSAVAAPPRYVVDAIEVTGTAEATHARLRVVFELTIQTDAWVELPLQLPNFIVQKLKIDDQLEGECLVFDKKQHGHVVWLSGKKGKKRKLVLEGLAKLKISTGGDGIELYLPRATRSQFLLQVPGSLSRFETSPELNLATTVQPDGTLELRLLGQANPLRLQWVSQEKTESNPSAVVEVIGRTTVRVDRRRAYYDATLKINSFGSPLDQIRVRLPQGAKWNAGQSVGDYEIREIEIRETDTQQAVRQGPTQKGKTQQGQILEIIPSRPQSKPWKIRLEAEQPLLAASGTAESVVGGFEVLGAFRQSGTLTLEIDDQLQAYFDTFGDVDQVSLKESNAKPTGRSALARFAYARFPWRLALFTSPRQRRISVRPSYELTLNAEEAQLQAEYKYLLTGAQIFSLHIDMNGWTLTDDPLESGGSVDRNRIVETREGHLVLPLVDPNVHEVRLQLTLRKNTELGDNTFLLPEPLGAFVVDGQLLVDSAEALRVTPKLDEMTGISVVSLSGPLSEKSTANENQKNASVGNPIEKSNDQVPQIEMHTFLPRPKFVAHVALQARQVTAQSLVHVEIDQQRTLVRQQLLYQAKYRPVSQLALRVPEPLWANDSLRVTLEGQELLVGLGTSLRQEPLVDGHDGLLDTDPPVDIDLPESAPPRRQLIISLPRPMQNEIPLEITYELPATDLKGKTPVPVELPLMIPTDPFEGHEAAIFTAPPILATVNLLPATGGWEQTNDDNSLDEEPSLKLRTEDNRSFLTFQVEFDTVDKLQLATLERAWLQSWMTHTQRQERAVFRFRTPHPTVFVQLPTDLEDAAVEVLLDGKPWEHEFLIENRLALELPAEGQSRSHALARSHALELRYQRPSSLPSWGTLRSNLPRLECHKASAPIYWQLVMPRGWQVATSPKQLIADYWLGWKNYRWGRQPTLSQTDLERFTGATSTVVPTPMSAEYLFRAFEVPVEIQVVVIRQAWVFLAGTLVAFGLGMLWLYTSLARNGIFWLCLTLILFAGIFSYPEITLLAIQTLLTGGLLTLVTFVLRHIFAERADAPLAAQGYPIESPAEATVTWQQPGSQHPKSQHTDAEETTATLRPGGPQP